MKAQVEKDEGPEALPRILIVAEGPNYFEGSCQICFFFLLSVSCFNMPMSCAFILKIVEKEDINISNDFMQNDDDGPKIVQKNCY